MIRRFFQLIVAFIPLYLFAIGMSFWWFGLVETISGWIITLLIGVLLLAIVEGVIFRFWLLPSWAQALSERFYGGNYFPADDPVVSLAQQIIDQHLADRVPELERLVRSDSSRTRAWMELARVTELELKDPQKAAEHMLTGARKVARKEDAAMLMWRAVTLLRKEDRSPSRAEEIRRDLIKRYPKTTYGRLAADRSEADE